MTLAWWEFITSSLACQLERLATQTTQATRKGGQTQKQQTIVAPMAGHLAADTKLLPDSSQGARRSPVQSISSDDLAQALGQTGNGFEQSEMHSSPPQVLLRYLERVGRFGKRQPALGTVRSGDCPPYPSHLDLTAHPSCAILALQSHTATVEVPQSPDARGTKGEAGSSPALSRNCKNTDYRTLADQSEFEPGYPPLPVHTSAFAERGWRMKDTQARKALPQET